MCTEPLYALRLKTEFDEKFQRFGRRSSLQVLKGVRHYIDEGIGVPSYDSEHYDLITISCGQCMQCRLLKTRRRAIQAVCEAVEHEKNCMITLTYGYPQLYTHYRHTEKRSHYISKKLSHFHEWSLETETFTKFMKRLRTWYYNKQLGEFLISIGRSDLVFNSKGEFKSHIRVPKLDVFLHLRVLEARKNFKKIRYLHCGEYGELHSRPHHHAILFGFCFDDLESFYQDGKKHYRSDTLEKLWKFGRCTVDECTYNSCAYVARYVTKKLYGDFAECVYDGRHPEYITSSTKKILGYNYFMKNFKEFTSQDEITVFDGKKVHKSKMISYFDNIVKQIDVKLYNKIKEKRITETVNDLQKLLSSERSVYSKLDANEKISLSIVSRLKRSYEKESNPNYDSLIAKLKAFGLGNAWLQHFKEKAVEYLRTKSYKNYIRKSTNQEIIDSYKQYEKNRKRRLSSCFDIRLTDEQAFMRYDRILKENNPYKVNKRGKKQDNLEYSDKDIYIDGIEELVIERS